MQQHCRGFIFKNFKWTRDTNFTREKPESIAIIKKLHEGKSAALAELINGAKDKVKMDKVVKDDPGKYSQV